MSLINKTIAAFAAMTILFGSASAEAEVLGTPSADSSWAQSMGGGADYYHNVFWSDSVGNQTENYVEYVPNTDAVPVVVNGASIYGRRTITSAANYMTENNLRPLAGINADFFSLKTGIPMGYTVIDGRIYSKEAAIQDAVGFRSDGTAFIDKIQIDTKVKKGDTQATVLYINKWPQKSLPYLYLLDYNYGSETKTSYKALYAICSAQSGELGIGKDLTLTVDECFTYDGGISIPDGKYVLMAAPDGDASVVSFLSSLAVGDTITVSSDVSYTENGSDWSQAENIVSAGASDYNNRIIKNGEVCTGFMPGAAPRTAVGITEAGHVIFYTLDGRQSGYSYGCQVTTLAKRMLELGCVEAINFDGGGSTAIGAVFPGTDSFLVQNKPSDGSLRLCANYIFLKDMRAQTGIPWYVEWQDIENYNYLAGSGVQLTAAKVYDTGNYKMDGLENVTYSVSNTDGAATTVTETGYVEFNGTGVSTVTAASDAYSKSFEFGVFAAPEEIRVTDEGSGGEYTSLSVYEGEMENFELEAAAYVNGIELVSNPSQFTWEVDGTLAEVDENGTVSVKDDGSGSAVLRVTCAGVVKEIPIFVNEKDTFSDTSGHWAHDIIESMADSGIINGLERDGTFVFMPDSNITRVQFNAVICNALGIDTSDYADTSLAYYDAADIQPWAVNHVKAMTALGYVTGKSDDDGLTVYFDPENTITRAEAFTIMGRIADVEAAAVPDYADKDEIPAWAESAIGSLAAAGIIKGYEDNTIQPNGYTTRAEAAALVSKFLETKGETK